MESVPHPLHALIVDDEPLARQRLSRLLAPTIEAGKVCLAGEAGDGVEALECLERTKVDLLFLDVQMPEMNGFDLLEHLPPKDRPLVIFTTAYEDYALHAFEANAIDYLLKPISRDRLSESIERAHRAFHAAESGRIRASKLDRLMAWIDDQPKAGAPDEDDTETRPVSHVSVSFRDRILLIPVERVISVEIVNGITRVFVLPLDPQGAAPSRPRHYVVPYTLDQFERMMPPSRFMRVHRSTIVQVDAIRELIPWFSGRYKLVLSGGHEVLASRERSKHLKHTLRI